MCRYEDQQKVRRAMAVQRVDPADVPATAKVSTPPMITPGISMPGPSADPLVGQKRKYQSDVAETSRSLSIPNANGVRSSPGDEEDDVMPLEPESVDELYCVMKTSIVGVQYYKGTSFCAFSQVRSCLLGQQVWLGLESKSGWLGNHTIDMTGKI